MIESSVVESALPADVKADLQFGALSSAASNLRAILELMVKDPAYRNMSISREALQNLSSIRVVRRLMA